MKREKLYWLGKGSLAGKVSSGQEIPESIFNKMDKKRIDEFIKKGLIGEIAKRIDPAQALESTDKKIQKAMTDMKNHIDTLDGKIGELEEKIGGLEEENMDLKKKLEDAELEKSILDEEIKKMQQVVKDESATG